MVNLGRAYLQKYYNEGQKSKEDLQTALETMASVRTQFPDQANAVARAEIRLARYHMEVKKDYPKAKTILEALRSSYPSPACAVEMEYQLAVCMRQQGDVDGCIAKCRKILEQYPKSDWCDYILYYIANCYSTSGRRREAIETYNKVIELYPAGEWAQAAGERVQTMTGKSPAGGAQ